METPPDPRMPRTRWITVCAGILLILLYAALFVGVAYGGLLPWTRKSTVIQNTPVPTPTPVAVSTPHILVYQPPSASIIRSADFSSGLGDWSLLYPVGKIESIDGRLVLQSKIFSQPVIGVNQDFIASAPKYYVQAEFSTDVPSDGGYGLVFGANKQGGTFYAFEVAPGFTMCRLWRFTQGRWDQLGKDIPAEFAAYPEPNILSAYFDVGRIELYINGGLLWSYIDNDPLRFTGVGVFVLQPGFRLYADNFFAYSEK
jgi:hypothetical protein